MTELREYIECFFPLTNAEWCEFSALFKPVFYKKGTIIYDFPEERKGLCFIVEGLLRSYKLTDTGRDYTWAFYCLNSEAIENRMLLNACMIEHLSFQQKQPSELTFEVLVDSRLICINKQDLEKLYESSVRWQKFARIVAENAYCSTQHRTISLLTKNAQERLEEIEEYFPALFEKSVLLDHIASYIGITRQSLNRLRRGESK